jgi:hypothetical protein
LVILYLSLKFEIVRAREGCQWCHRCHTYVGTLGSTIRVGYSMMIHCGNWDCHHRAPVDLEALQARLGTDYPVVDLVARAVCSECDARWPKISITVHPEAPKVIGEWKHGTGHD